MKLKNGMMALGLLTAMSSGVQAAVTPEQAVRLEQDLTPMGSERAGNADGSIPAWDPANLVIPESFEPGSGHYPDPYADEEPILVIDASNWQQHKEFLTEGTQALFESLGADGFRMDIYPTHRNYVPPQWHIDNTRHNATNAQLMGDGQKVEGNLPAIPFPIPQNGLEVIWNHMIRHLEDYFFLYDVYYVSSNGKPVLATTGEMDNVFPMYQTENRDKEVGDTPWLKIRINYKAPARRAGEILLVHEPGADYTEGKGRKAWQYLVGQRRVRLAPAVSFDTPNPGVAGTSTYDDSFVYNGSPERFDWKLIGKKEMYVPYSTYAFNFEHKIEDILGEKYLEPSAVRWEKHRVWIVEADLKEGSRHLYSKRRYYIDEDSWSALAADNYDGQGKLWRVQYMYSNFLFDSQSLYSYPYGAYDLVQGIYNLNSKPIPGTFRVGSDKNDKYFTAKGMSRSGIR